jgi:acyl-CoA thioester hydrolase
VSSFGCTDPASIRVERKLEWVDTDASGHWHNTAALRMAEAAEIVLLERLGILDKVHMRHPPPRVQINVRFHRPLYFNEVAQISLEVTDIGGASITYRCEIADGSGELCAELTVVAVLRGADGRAAMWPAELRRLLLTAGQQEPPLPPA